MTINDNVNNLFKKIDSKLNVEKYQEACRDEKDMILSCVMNS